MSPPLSIEEKKQLHTMYYDQKNFFGRDRLFQLAKSLGMTVSRRQIMEWLAEQELYQLFKRVYQTQNVQRTLLTKPNKQIGIDLVDMQNKQYKGYQYILTAIDLFSKKAYAEPMKNKTDAETVRCMKTIMKRIGTSISSIRSDNGSEFTNKRFVELLKKEKIKQVLSLPYKPQSNGQVERFNGVLKKLINQELKYTNSYDWPSILQQLVENYNNTVHNTTKKTPNEITEKDFEVVHDNIKKAVVSKRQSEGIHFDVGDTVRIKETDKNKDGIKWSKKLYTIEKVYRPRKVASKPCYFIVGSPNKYYENDLQKIENVDNAQ